MELNKNLNGFRVRTRSQQTSTIQSEQGSISDKKSTNEHDPVRTGFRFGQKDIKRARSSPNRVPIRTERYQMSAIQSEQGSNSDKKSTNERDPVRTGFRFGQEVNKRA
ncbi:hypothetical protein R4Z10_16965 [Niallia sp. XMNu-256]|uniref:hypothetical protein n=1 Tax=Niallia sp. XMNu-256 TaxID=3082444 RepID=UPI0030CEE28A